MITGAGPDGGDVAPDELCPPPLLCPLPLDGTVVEAGLAAVDAVVLAALPLPDEHPPTRTAAASATLTTAMRPVDIRRRPARPVLGTLAVMDLANMAVSPLWLGSLVRVPERRNRRTELPWFRANATSASMCLLTRCWGVLSVFGVWSCYRPRAL